MNIALHDSDKTNFPNLALMKLSSHYKAQGDDVGLFQPLLSKRYDRIFSSKVFTYTDEDPFLPVDAEKGGTGYGFDTTLPDNIEHICPDYNLYHINYSIGFLTRGCIRHCEHCIVPAKEGAIREHADIEEFARHKKVVLLDNNVLAHPHGLAQIEKIARLGLSVDFNQGLDAKLINDGIARRLGAVKWLAPLRLACDSKGQIEAVRKAIELLRWHNVTPRRYFCYVLVKDIPDAIERVKFLKGMNINPFAQPYRDREGTEPTDKQKHFARWVNHKAEFYSRTWEEYAETHKVYVEVKY